MLIREAKLDDVKKCYKLSKIRELLTAKKEPIPLSYFEDIIKERKTIFLVVEEDKKIIGYSTADLLPGKLAIWWLLVVHPDYQNKGIGKKLSDKIEEKLKKKGVKYIVGYTPKFNEKTKVFHKKRGFSLGEEMIEILKDID